MQRGDETEYAGKKQAFLKIWSKVEPYIKRRELTKDEKLRVQYRIELVNTYNNSRSFLRQCIDKEPENTELLYDCQVHNNFLLQKLKHAFSILRLSYDWPTNKFGRIDLNKITQLPIDIDLEGVQGGVSSSEVEENSDSENNRACSSGSKSTAGTSGDSTEPITPDQHPITSDTAEEADISDNISDQNTKTVESHTTKETPTVSDQSVDRISEQISRIAQQISEEIDEQIENQTPILIEEPIANSDSNQGQNNIQAQTPDLSSDLSSVQTFENNLNQSRSNSPQNPSNTDHKGDENPIFESNTNNLDQSNMSNDGDGEGPHVRLQTKKEFMQKFCE